MKPDRPSLCLSVIPLPAPLRLDLYLHQLFPHVSRTDQAQLFDHRAILLNGRAAAKSARVGGREALTLLPEAAAIYSLHALAANIRIPLNLVYEDNDLFAVDKPAGIDTLPQRLTDSNTLGNALLSRWPNLIKVGRSPFDCGLLQRLDRDTSGLVLGAKSQAMWEKLHAEMKAGKIEKGYLAQVEGIVSEDRGEIRFRLESRSRHSERMRVHLNQTGDTLTRWRVLERCRDTTLLDITILKGARHQIRAHLAAIGHPLVGDILYGASAGSGDSHRYLLHARTLVFSHPRTGAALRLESPLPAAFDEIIGR